MLVNAIWQFGNDSAHPVSQTAQSTIQASLQTGINEFTLGVIWELTIMLSSCVLIMTCWEAFRGFNKATPTQQAQRITFIGTFISAVAICKLVDILYPGQAHIQQLTIDTVTVAILLSTQIQLIWHSRSNKRLDEELEQSSQLGSTSKVINLSKPNTSNKPITSSKPLTANKPKAAQTTIAAYQQIEISEENKEDARLAQQIERVLIENKQFLQANLKVADVARELNEPEYKISQALRQHCKAKNFNQFVNELRIEHAKSLLTDAEKQKWPVLVVGMESGFASVGPFTRAFKTITGFTPNQYRKEYCEAKI